ncbi:MAG TPA: tail fiber domain-containing protein [Saprospiraceae bacterium]|nr:tail fiber domain-containing protein [Saprospiraceae bacterium]
MMKSICIWLIIFLVHAFSFGQNVGIGITSPAAKLHIKGSANVSQLIIDAHSSQSNTSPLLKLRNSSGSDLLWIQSDTALNTFIGIYAGRVNNAIGGGVFNTYSGSHAGYSCTTGNSNSGFGANSLFLNTTGNFNSAHGLNSLFSNGSGSWNTAMGANALFANTTGNSNTAVGNTALISNTTGSSNTATGSDALNHNISGTSNTANGFKALFNNTTGSVNTANGYHALYSSTIGFDNTAIGANALYSNISGSFNTAIGFEALFYNESGVVNTAIGRETLNSNTTGIWNTALGGSALYSNTTGSNNSGIGMNTNVSIGTLTNATALGYNTSVNASNKVRIGSSAVSVIEGQVSYSWPSDGRFKENIQADVKGLDFILRLQPISYNFNRLKYARHVREHLTLDSEEILVAQSQIRSVGFIAQDVEDVIQQTGFTSFDAVHAPTNETDNYSIGYSAFVVPLVKAIQEQQDQITELKKDMELLKEQNDLLVQLLRQKN